MISIYKITILAFTVKIVLHNNITNNNKTAMRNSQKRVKCNEYKIIIHVLSIYRCMVSYKKILFCAGIKIYQSSINLQKILR